MSKRTTVLMAAAALSAAVLPVFAAPTAGADVCAGADGRHFAAGGCTNVAGDVVAGAAVAGDVAVGTAIAAEHVPYVPGEIPCYTVEGVPYYTPPGDPC